VAANLVVRAEVVDVRSDTPTSSDAFLVDTNVWYWLTYTRASQTAQPYQVQDYPSFIQKCLSTNARLYWCGVSLAELSHLIEAQEWQIFQRTNNASVNHKEYRHNYAAERANTVAEIEAAWAQIRMLAVPLPLTIDDQTTDAAIARLRTQPVDGYDLFLLEAMSVNGIKHIITDDGDYTTVPGIRVFSASFNAIAQAHSQRKLLTR
jgi:predicted nucleic acid-binding protein